MTIGAATAFQVHRWTASALERETASEVLQDAHRRAAPFWHWRVDRIPQSRQADIDQLLEARHHHHAAGDIEQAVEVTEWICSQLDTWGAYGREEQLCREVLEWVPARSEQAGHFLLRLGMIAQRRGSYDDAGERYRDSLKIAEEFGDRGGVARSYHQLGMVAEARGSDEEALEWYSKAAEISEELGNRANLASSYHHLGIVAQRQGSYDEALGWYRKSLVIKEELGNRGGIATSYHHLGMVAEARDSYDEALEWYSKSLAIKEELGNRAGLAVSYHHIGVVAEMRGFYDEALQWYRKSLMIEEELGNRAGVASSLSQIGVLLTKTSRPREAVPWNLRSLVLRLEIGVPDVRVDLHWLSRQREALGEESFTKILREHLDTEAVVNLLRMLNESERHE